MAQIQDQAIEGYASNMQASNMGESLAESSAEVNPELGQSHHQLLQSERAQSNAGFD